MDENGLPITGAGVNYTSVEAINQRELITYFNMFLVRTCAFMNTFSTKCESKLANLHLRLENINTSLTLLEAKLNSVDELRDLKLENNNASVASVNNQPPQQQQQQQNIPNPSISSPPPPPPLPSQTATTEAAPVSAPPPPPPVPVLTVSQDPRFKKYFTMLKVGVLEEAVRIKMKTEGLDPNLISTPDAPAPPPDQPQSSDENDDSDSD